MFWGKQINHPGPRPKTVCPIWPCGEAAFQRWSCNLVSFGEKKYVRPLIVRPSCWLCSHRSFGVRIWRRIRCRSSTVCSRSNSGYCPLGDPNNDVTGHFNSATAALCGYVKTAARETVVENHRLSFSLRSGGCKRIAHFASTFCKELRRIGARLEILSRCGQRLLPQPYYP